MHNDPVHRQLSYRSQQSTMVRGHRQLWTMANYTYTALIFLCAASALYRTVDEPHECSFYDCMSCSGQFRTNWTRSKWQTGIRLSGVCNSPSLTLDKAIHKLHSHWSQDRLPDGMDTTQSIFLTVGVMSSLARWKRSTRYKRCAVAKIANKLPSKAIHLIMIVMININIKHSPLSLGIRRRISWGIYRHISWGVLSITASAFVMVSPWEGVL